MLGLAFSGGKDSLACWYLYRDQQPVVIWVNSGKGYPETRAIVDEVRKEARQFIELYSNVAEIHRKHGLPSDLVPVDHTDAGMIFTGEKDTRVQSYLQCCAITHALPMHNYCRANYITHLVRGQRNEESHKSPSKHGDGIEYIHPIENWTEQQVLDFIREKRGSLPDHYKIKHSSLDCYNCTGFAAHSQDRVAWMKEKHPAFYAEYARNQRALADTINPLAAPFREI